jgi:hypothetical protein
LDWNHAVPPPQPHRYTRRHHSAELQAALLAETHQLASIVDPVERIEAINDFFAQFDFELEAFGDTRLEAVSELRAQGWSYHRIAVATRLSKARVAQLVKAASRADPGPRVTCGSPCDKHGPTHG